MPGYPVPKKLQRRRRRRPPGWRPPPLTIAQILAWADAWRQRSARWPIIASGGIPGSHGDTWLRINAALSQGLRGLHGGSSLAQLLAEHRGVRNRARLPRLTERLILYWAERWRRQTGRWPTRASGPIAGTGGETWTGIDRALKDGLRGLPGRASLATLLHRERRVRHNRFLARFKSATLLRWADAFHDRTGRWPSQDSGTIPESPGETWSKVHVALRTGGRGLPGGSSLSEFLFEHRGVRRGPRLPRLTVKLILAWADDHFRRTGNWPRVDSGAVLGVTDEKWRNVDAALGQGLRGLAGASSLAKLLHAHRGVRTVACLPPLSERQVLAWADAHRARTGNWPSIRSGAVTESPGETWQSIQRALLQGLRGLAGKSSLARLLAAERGKPNHLRLPPLAEPAILAWVDAFHARHGTWPSRGSGVIPGAPPDVTWATVDRCLHDGSRGLPGGSSLALLLERERGRPHPFRKPRLTMACIQRWAREHRARTGRWPQQGDGEVMGVQGETWHDLDAALRNGARGLRGGSSLAQLVRRMRGG